MAQLRRWTAFITRNPTGTNYVALMPNKQTMNYPLVSDLLFLFLVTELAGHTAELGFLAAECGL